MEIISACIWEIKARFLLCGDDADASGVAVCGDVGAVVVCAELRACAPANIAVARGGRGCCCVDGLDDRGTTTGTIDTPAVCDSAAATQVAAASPHDPATPMVVVSCAEIMARA